MKNKVLLIDDDPAVRASLTQTLELADYIVVQANGLAQARRAIRANFAGVVLTDIRMPGDDGFDVLAKVQAVDSELPVIFLTGEADVPMAVRALQAGVYDFLEKPCTSDALLAVLGRALKHRAVVLQARRLETILAHSDAAAIHFPGTTDPSIRLRKDLRFHAAQSTHILFSGPVGSGRRLAAHTLNVLSGWTGAVVSANFEKSDAMDALIEAESKGCLLVLKNLDHLSKSEFNTLLRQVEVLHPSRILLTSKMHWDSLLKAHDNLNKLGTVATIPVPSLAERKADVAVIFDALIRQLARDQNMDKPEIGLELLEHIENRTWPGNIAELRDIAKNYLKSGILEEGIPLRPLSEQVQAFEKNVLIDCLKRHNGSASRAAEEMNLPRKTLYDKLARYGIQPKLLSSRKFS